MAFAETFKALSDPERRKILELLKTGPMSAGDIASNFDTTGATISYLLPVKYICTRRNYAMDSKIEGG